MGKNSKKPAATPEAAPAVEQKNAPAQTESQREAMFQHFVSNYQGLSPDATAMALERISKIAIDDPKACENLNMTSETQKQLSELVLVGMTTLIITDVVAKKTPFAITMNKAHFEVVKATAEAIGTPFVGNYLPTLIDDEKVKVEVNDKTIQVKEAVAEEIKKEAEVAAQTVELDPTKFNSEEDLASALKHIIVSEKGAFLKFTRCTALLKSYMLIQAGDNKEEKDKINAISVSDLLNKVFEIVGRMPIILTGFGKYLYRETSQTMSPVLAFCKLRDASKNNVGVPTVSSAELAGITSNLVTYCANDGIANEESKIAGYQKDIELLSNKDKKKNAKGIEDLNAKIETCKANIQHFKDVIDCVNNPSFNMAETFIDDYDNNESENHTIARKTFGYVVDSYYSRDDAKTANQEQLKKDVQQAIGIITNLFHRACDKSEVYSSSRLTIFDTKLFEAEESKN